MVKSKAQYKCSECGKVYPKWQGQCDECKAWNTLEEHIETTSKRGLKSYTTKPLPKPLRTVKSGEDKRIVIPGMSEFNRVMGGGIVEDSVSIITAPPGTGKSTLLLMVGNAIAHMGKTVYYVSGEESETQIKSRADRICANLSDNLIVEAESCMDIILEHIEAIDPDFIIMDSIQTVYLQEINSSQGSPKQVEECTRRFIDVAKKSPKKRAIFLVGQQNKDEELVGRMTLQHLVDTVLYLDSSDSEQFICAFCSKNRYGDTGEVSLFEMTGEGLMEISNPSQFFMTQREENVPGSALTITRLGNRNFIVEIESLVNPPTYAYPKRTWENSKRDVLDTLLAILHQRAGMPVNEKDVVVKVIGGLKLTEPAINLGVMMSIVSSVYNRALPKDSLFVGEVGLTGELKRIPNLESRIKEADRMGFKYIFVPKGNLRKDLSVNQIKVVESSSVVAVIRTIYSDGGRVQDGK